MGHAYSGYISYFKGDLYYYDLIKLLVRFAEDQTKVVDLENNCLKWDVSLYIDTDFSGSAIDVAKLWFDENGGYHEWPLNKVNYFKQNCELDI